MRNLIDLVETYHQYNSQLLRYMDEASFDPYRYWWDVCKYLWDHEGDNLEDWFGQSFSSLDDLHGSIDPDDFEKIPPNVRAHIEDHVYLELSQYPEELPTHRHMSLEKTKLLPRTTWLVHFSDSADKIAREGFKYGVDEMDRLALTSYMSIEAKKAGGYNFAFLALSPEARMVSHDGKYGRDAVIFQNAGVMCYHYGDEERQILFHGSAVDPTNIFLLQDRNDHWCVVPRNPSAKRDALFTGTYEKAVQWIIQNHAQYRGVL